MLYDYIIPALWLAWLVYWWVSAQDVKTTQRHESPASRAAHIVPLLVAAWLLWQPVLPGGFLDGHMFPPSLTVFWIGTAIVVAGILISVWARIHLGRNWSGTVTIKHDHELIRSGPYRFVRHPVYTGLLTALVGSAVAHNRWFALLAVLIAFVALWRKLKLEERWMVETFGEEYIAYRAKVAALIPYLL